MPAARPLICAAGAFALAGCLGSVPDSTPEAQTKAPTGLASFFKRDAGAAEGKPAPLARVSLAGGDVVVAGPDGYCIDPVTKSSTLERGFAVVASCQILSGGKTGRNVVPMLVTVTVGSRGTVADLPTPDGLADASGAALVSWKIAPDRVTAHLASGGEAMFDGSDPRYWRSAFLQGDRLVGMALYAPRGSALAGEDGAVMLGRIKDRIARLSTAGPSAASKAAPKPDRPGGVLGRLFNTQN